jgi:hypothetical protein
MKLTDILGIILVVTGYAVVAFVVLSLVAAILWVLAKLLPLLATVIGVWVLVFALGGAVAKAASK